MRESFPKEFLLLSHLRAWFQQLRDIALEGKASLQSVVAESALDSFPLRRTLLTGAIIFSGVDLLSFYLPIYGHSIGLSATTIGALKQLQGPVSIKAYAVRQDSSGSNVHKIIEERVRPYQRVKADLQLQLIDPREEPKLAAEAGLRTPNALVLEYQRRIEQIPLAEFSEQSFANALLRLARGANNLVLWIDGHGERKLDGLANHDLGAFGHRLREKGFSISSLNLAVAQEVPENAALLVSEW